MPSPARLYQQEMHNNVGFFAAWLPSDTNEIGDIGVFENGQFRRQGSLRELGISSPGAREGEAQKMSYSASVDRRVVGTASATAIAPVAGGELSIRFSQQGGFVFEAEGVRKIEIADRISLANQVLDLYRNTVWKAEWHLIDAVYTAASATVLVSEDSSSEIVLRANAAAVPTAWPLTDAKLGLSVSSSTGRVACIIAAAGLKPLYSCVKIRSHFFRDPSLEAVRGMETNPSDVLARPGIDALLDS
jgi:hypothetical protein